MNLMNPSNDWSDEVKALIAKAQQEEQNYNTSKAIEYYQNALDLIPDPVESYFFTTEICIAIGEIYYLDHQPEQALEYFSQAVRSKGGLGMLHIHLRLGQLRYERGEFDRAKDELMRAYMDGGKRIFELEDPKYYEVIKDIVERNDQN